MNKKAGSGKNKSGAATADREAEQLATLEHAERELDATIIRKRRKSLSPEQRREILNQLFVEGSVRTFFTLLTLSTVIATLGLMLPSPAVVIGAMLISPLMTPILGVASAIVMGWHARVLRVGMRLLLATLFVFSFAYLIPLLFQLPQEVQLTEDILARTNPTVADLLVALCAGIAAAYMLVRKEALSALPGVAIAVALVPPLCVSGILTYLQEYRLAWEAFILYATNLTAILLMAGAVLFAMGFKPKVRDFRLHFRVATGFFVATAIVAAVGVPLGARTYNDIVDMRNRVLVIDVVENWIGEERVDIVDIEVRDDLIEIQLRANLPFEDLQQIGSQPLRNRTRSDMTMSSLQQHLNMQLGKPVDITIKGSFGFWDSTCTKPSDCYFN